MKSFTTRLIGITVRSIVLIVRMPSENVSGTSSSLFNLSIHAVVSKHDGVYDDILRIIPVTEIYAIDNFSIDIRAVVVVSTETHEIKTNIS